ncbi:carboxylic ester hydrolase [Elysia marginata]|uniref:Carboxylic ester hydrolase n=1 Tax=Elysia marginata TaxID=1093978 RepID=A0AAV4FND8_9GAST|nr:carboxylic ester hydrolase [Elysia marginata]
MAGLIRSVVRGKFNLPVETEALNVVDFVYTFPRDKDGKIPLQKFLELQTDDSFTVPLVLFARGLIEASPATQVYMYLFDAEPRAIVLGEQKQQEYSSRNPESRQREKVIDGLTRWLGKGRVMETLGATVDREVWMDMTVNASLHSTLS